MQDFTSIEPELEKSSHRRDDIDTDQASRAPADCRIRAVDLREGPGHPIPQWIINISLC